MKLRAMIIAGCSLLMIGCGTVSTVGPRDAAISRDLKRSKTYCHSIPRVYSGVAYDLCQLHREPVPGVKWQSPSAFDFFAFDVVLSGIADTAVLPYTIYRQREDGNIRVQ